MGEVSIATATDADMALLARDMRPADRREVLSMGMIEEGDILPSLIKLLQKSRGLAMAAYYDGSLACVYGVGVSTMIAPEGNPWMLGTRVLEDRRAQRAFVRLSREALLPCIPPLVSHLWNYTDATNEVALGWLKWLGFDLADETHEFNGVLWRRFDMRA